MTESAPSIPGPSRSGDLRGVIDPFLELHGWCIALGLALVGLWLRCHNLDIYWLNPDEGIYYSSLSGTYEAMLREYDGNAHPPFFYYFLYWLAENGGTDDFMLLRWPSALFGTVAIYGIWLAVREISNPLAGLLAAAMLALSPSMIEQSQIIRPYMMLLAFTAYAVWFAARYIRGKGAWNLLPFALCELIMVGTHYSAFLAFGAIGATIGGSWLLKRISFDQFLALLLGQTPALVAMAYFYFVHIRGGLEGGALQEEAMGSWLKPFLMDGPDEIWWLTGQWFQYVFGYRYSGTCFVLFLAGVGIAIDRKRMVVWLPATAALAIAVGLSFLQKYPYGGTRHSIYLVPFFIPVLAYGASWLLRQRPKIAGMALAGLGLMFLVPQLGNVLMTQGQTLAQEKASERLHARSDYDDLEGLLENIQNQDEILVMNMQAYYLLVPFFNELRQVEQWESWYGIPGKGQFFTFMWGRCRVIVYTVWQFNEQDASSSLKTLARSVQAHLPELDFRRREDLWIMEGGWGAALLSYIGAVNARNLRSSGDGRLGELISEPTTFKAVGTNKVTFVGMRFNLKGYLAYIREKG